ncbi:MAG: hypothetical protein Ct9H300mP30_2980 [Methanobacteriota archaeon]|nr:MAG: hypothetical protein Ct9H300mP30_2980 [Euryarchaeota archaeon]
MWVATGSFPPMVVVESGSMMHEEEGSLGAIDPGDLVLVMDPDRVDIVTFVEATDPDDDHFGHQSHGMLGDVIIYRKNGGSDTPVIHRAMLKAVANSSGGWDVPGTTLRNVGSITGDTRLPVPLPRWDLRLGDRRLGAGSRGLSDDRRQRGQQRLRRRPDSRPRGATPGAA